MIPITFNGSQGLLKVGKNRVEIRAGDFKQAFQLRSVVTIGEYALLMNQLHVIETAYASQFYMQVLSLGCIYLAEQQIALAERPKSFECSVNGSCYVAELHATYLQLGTLRIYYQQISDLSLKPPAYCTFRAPKLFLIQFNAPCDYALVTDFIKAYLPTSDAQICASTNSSSARPLESQVRRAKTKFMQTMQSQVAQSAIMTPSRYQAPKETVEQSFDSESQSEAEFQGGSTVYEKLIDDSNDNVYQSYIAEDVLNRAENALLGDLGPRLFDKIRPYLERFRAYFGVRDEKHICRDILTCVRHIFDCVTRNTPASYYEASVTDSLDEDSLPCEKPTPHTDVASCPLVLKPEMRVKGKRG